MNCNFYKRKILEIVIEIRAESWISTIWVLLKLCGEICDVPRSGALLLWVATGRYVVNNMINIIC